MTKDNRSSLLASQWVRFGWNYKWSLPELVQVRPADSTGLYFDFNVTGIRDRFCYILNPNIIFSIPDGSFHNI
jgi:hypothetical protein